MVYCVIGDTDMPNVYGHSLNVFSSTFGEKIVDSVWPLGLVIEKFMKY